MLNTIDQYAEQGQMEAYSLHTASLWDYARVKVLNMEFNKHGTSVMHDWIAIESPIFKPFDLIWRDWKIGLIWFDFIWKCLWFDLKI